MAPSGRSSLRALASQRPFLLYSIGNFVSLTGTWAQRVAVAWLAWRLTESELWVGIVAFVDLVPGILVAPVAGALADRVDLMRLCMLLQSLTAIQGALLFVLGAFGLLDIYLLCALTFALGVINAVDHPVRLAMVSDLLAERLLSAGVGLNATMFNLARFVGPLGAGVMIGAVGTGAVFLANAASSVAFTIALLFIGKRIVKHVRPQATGGYLHDIGEGLAYLRGQTVIMAAMLLIAATALGVRPVMELLPPFADEIASNGFVGHGAEALAILTSITALGALAASLWMTLGARQAAIERSVYAAHLASAVCLLIFLFVPSTIVSLLALGLCGCVLVIAGVGTQTIIQLQVERRMRGRVLSLFTAMNRGVPAVGALTIGWLGTYAGLRPPLAAGALLSIAAVLAVLWMRRGRPG